MRLIDRVEKSFPEKYGICDITEEIEKFKKDNARLLSEESIFDRMPYVGILYVPILLRFVDYWYDFKTNTLAKSNNGNFLKFKVAACSDTHITAYCYNDHEGWIHRIDNKHENFSVVGNILKEKDNIEAKRLLIRK